MKKIYILLGVVIAFAGMAKGAEAASITSLWYTTPQTMEGNFIATYKGNTTDPFSLSSFNIDGKIRDHHEAVIPFTKGQGIQSDIERVPNPPASGAPNLVHIKTFTHDSRGMAVIDNYNLNIRKNFDTAYITLTGTSTDISEVLFLVMEIHNANGSVALQQFGTYFDTSQTGFAQMNIKARNLAPGQTLAVYPVFKGVTINEKLTNVTFRVDLYSSSVI